MRVQLPALPKSGSWAERRVPLVPVKDEIVDAEFEEIKEEIQNEIIEDIE